MKKCLQFLTVALVLTAVFAAFPETVFARTYFPHHGRFAQIDPVRHADLNLYRYARNNPTTYTDPYGRQPKSITVTFEPPASNAAYAYSFWNEVKVTGKNLTNYQIRQQARVYMYRKDYKGKKMTTAAILDEVSLDPTIAAAVNKGNFVTDTNWDWKTMDKNTVYTTKDGQLHNVQNRRAVWSTDSRGVKTYSYEIKLDKTTRDFKVQIRCKPTNANPNPPIVMEFAWGYTWDNYIATRDGITAWAHLGKGEFYKIYGITGIPFDWQRHIGDFPPPGGWDQPLPGQPQKEYAKRSDHYPHY